MTTPIDLMAIGEPPVGDDVLRVRMRYMRDQLLAASDYTMLPDVDCDKMSWALYRQRLRDAPAHWTPAPVWEAPSPPSGPTVTTDE